MKKWDSAVQEACPKVIKKKSMKKVIQKHLKKKSMKTRKKKGYVKSWSIRARFASRWMAEAMKKKKKKKKKIAKFSTSGFSSARFSRLVPDSGQWMLRMTPRKKHLVNDLLKLFRFLRGTWGPAFSPDGGSNPPFHTSRDLKATFIITSQASRLAVEGLRGGGGYVFWDPETRKHPPRERLHAGGRDDSLPKLFQTHVKAKAPLQVFIGASVLVLSVGMPVRRCDDSAVQCIAVGEPKGSHEEVHALVLQETRVLATSSNCGDACHGLKKVVLDIGGGTCVEAGYEQKRAAQPIVHPYVDR